MSNMIAVIVPAYNETESIVPVIEGLQGLRGRLADQGLDLQLIVIDDGSTDDTAEKARMAGADQLVAHKRNMGLGAAVRTGLSIARDLGADVCVKFDADLQHDPADILKVIDPILRGQAELVYGERFSNIEYKMPLVRRWGNRVFTRLMRQLTGWPVVDSQPGIFAASRDYLAVFEIPGDYNYTQQVLLDAFLKGMRFSQVSVSFRQRRSGRSFVSFKYPYKVLRQIILVTAITKPMAIFFPLGLIMLLFASVLFTFQMGQWMLGVTPRPVQNVNLVLGSAMFGLQIMMFGILAKLIVMTRQTARAGSVPDHLPRSSESPALHVLAPPSTAASGKGSDNGTRQAGVSRRFTPQSASG